MNEKNSGSILNEEYTKRIEELYECIRKANKIHDDLPACIKEAKTAWTGDSVVFYLHNSLNAIWHLAKSFGIEVDESEE